MHILLEVIGYIGTALILLSMVMTSVTWLRRVNVLGSVFSMIYGLFCNTWPTVLLNMSLIVINVVQLHRLRKEKKGQGGKNDETDN